MKLVAPQFVKPCVTTNKTDANDAEAICVVTSQRTAKANQLRELTYEYGLVGFAFGHCRPACTTTCSSSTSGCVSSTRRSLRWCASTLYALVGDTEARDELRPEPRCRLSVVRIYTLMCPRERITPFQ